MSTKTFFDQWVKPEFAKSIPGVPRLTFDMKAVLESNRKTLQALTEAQHVAVESLQSIAQRQAEILSQIVQDHSAIAREIVNQGSPEDKIARGAELARRAYEKTVTGIREVTDMANKSGREAGDIITVRVANALTEIASSIEGQPAKAKKSDKAEQNSKQAA
jgi:phasin family protein